MPDNVAVYTKAGPGLGRFAVPCVVGTPLLENNGTVSWNGKYIWLGVLWCSLRSFLHCEGLLDHEDEAPTIARNVGNRSIKIR